MIVGIDPGGLGAIAWVSETGELMEVFDMPTVDVRGKLRVSAPLLKALFPRRPKMVVIEDVHGIARSSAASSFAFGRAAGVVEGVCAALDFPTHFVRPTEWKKALKLTSDKGLSRQRAQRLWPDQANRFSRVKDDGRAEAALLAYWMIYEFMRDSPVRPLKNRELAWMK